jgi:hypothetical protein
MNHANIRVTQVQMHHHSRHHRRRTLREVQQRAFPKLPRRPRRQWERTGSDQPTGPACGRILSIKFDVREQKRDAAKAHTHLRRRRRTVAFGRFHDKNNTWLGALHCSLSPTDKHRSRRTWNHMPCDTKHNSHVNGSAGGDVGKHCYARRSRGRCAHPVVIHVSADSPRCDGKGGPPAAQLSLCCTVVVLVVGVCVHVAVWYVSGKKSYARCSLGSVWASR